MLDFTAKNVKKGRITVKIASKWLFLGENKEIIYKSTLILLKILHWIHSDHRKNNMGPVPQCLEKKINYFLGPVCIRAGPVGRISVHACLRFPFFSFSWWKFKNHWSSHLPLAMWKVSSHWLNGFYPSSLLVRICELPIGLPLPSFKFLPRRYLVWFKLGMTQCRPGSLPGRQCVIPSFNQTK